MNTIKNSALQTQIAKKFNLEFDKKFHYYIGNAYKDSKGEYLKNYMYHNGRIFMLQYVSGCFNPYLVELDKSKFGLIMAKNSCSEVLDKITGVIIVKRVEGLIRGDDIKAGKLPKVIVTFENNKQVIMQLDSKRFIKDLIEVIKKI